MNSEPVRLTQYAHGGGCACKLPPWELEELIAGLAGQQLPSDAAELLVGLGDGDDAAVMRLNDESALIVTTDFFTPVVDDAYDWGRIAAANAISDIYAMGGAPVMAVNILGWPRDALSAELMSEVVRGGRDIAQQASCHLAGGHSIDDPEPKYGLAVTGIGSQDALMRIDRGAPGVPISLTKPLGIGVLNTRHKATGEVFRQAVEAMTTLNRDASIAAVSAGIRCATDVTGFGLLGHLYKLARASQVSARLDSAAVSYLEGAREAVRDGYVSGGTRRNLEWVAPYTSFAGTVSEADRLLLADAQTSGGLLVAGEVPGGVVVGELTPQAEHTLVVG